MSTIHRGEVEIPPNLCELLENSETHQLAIHVLRATPQGAWEAWCVFPDTMHNEAFIRFSMLQTEKDVEGLIREWAPEGVIDQFQMLMALE